jgi:hypothetical protein
MKWMTDLDDKLMTVEALARAFDLLGLSRYSAICRSEATGEILRAYEESIEDGRAAFRRAHAASGIQPPDLPEFRWGPVMGFQEASAYSSTAGFLELAVAGGDLATGARGWKSRQQELVRTHLNIQRTELLGQTLGQAILTERIDTWVNARRSETRRKLLAAIADRLLHPPPLPAETTDGSFAPLPWLMQQLAEGVALTQTGNLNQRFVQGAAEQFGWDFSRPPRTEDDLFDLHQLRHLSQRLGLARRSGRKLGLTSKGRALLGEPEALWRTVAQGLLGGDGFSVFSGEMFLALVVDVDAMPEADINATVSQAVAEEGFRDARTGAPPEDRVVSWGIHDTSNLCRALGVLSTGGDWRDRSYGLTDVGKAMALEALRGRATGPRTTPWG